MNNITEYKDLMAFHPGYYIAEVIEDMEISQAEFAQRLGTTPKNLSTILNGQISLSDDIAGKLSAMLGTSTSLWMNLQMAYNQKILEIERERKLDDQMEVESLIDYSFFVKLSELPRAKTAHERIINLCRYLRVSDLNILKEPDFLVNYRTGISSIQMKNIVNSRAWIQTAINLSGEIVVKPFDCGKLKESLPEFRKMTLQEPESFLPRMRDLFSECGIAFVLLPNLRNCGVNGAVKWINSERVVLAMNDRGADADRFWFSLFHEIKHVLQQKVKTVFVNSSVTEMMDMNSKYEEEADSFASDYLIPPAAYKRFAPTKYTSDSEIEAFASSIGIHPGIVAGRLQHDRIIEQNRCSGMKVRYRISDLVTKSHES